MTGNKTNDLTLCFTNSYIEKVMFTKKYTAPSNKIGQVILWKIPITINEINVKTNIAGTKCLNENIDFIF